MSILDRSSAPAVAAASWVDHSEAWTDLVDRLQDGMTTAVPAADPDALRCRWERDVARGGMICVWTSG